MTRLAPWPFAALPAFPAERYSALGERIGRVLGAEEHDVVLVPGEAIVALEAAAREAGGSRRRFLNVATSVYGRLFGDWLADAGGEVTTVSAAVAGQPVAIDEIRAALSAGRFDAISFVHGEAATGIVNPIADILAEARGHGLVAIVDAVASVGAEPLALGEDGPDIVVVGPQKGLRGPAGVSAVAINARGWSFLARPPRRASLSSLSLLDIRRDWIDSDRTAIPGTPAPHELWALDAALDAIEHEGIDVVVARHRLAARAARSGARALGIATWTDDEERSSGLTTGVLLPQDADRARVIALAQALFGVTLAVGPEGVDPRLVRIRHTAAEAAFEPVLAAVAALGGALVAAGADADIAAGAAAVVSVYAEARHDDAHKD